MNHKEKIINKLKIEIDNKLIEIKIQESNLERIEIRKRMYEHEYLDNIDKQNKNKENVNLIIGELKKELKELEDKLAQKEVN